MAPRDYGLETDRKKKTNSRVLLNTHIMNSSFAVYRPTAGFPCSYPVTAVVCRVIDETPWWKNWEPLPEAVWVGPVLAGSWTFLVADIRWYILN